MAIILFDSTLKKKFPKQCREVFERIKPFDTMFVTKEITGYKFKSDHFADNEIVLMKGYYNGHYWYYSLTSKIF